MLYTIPDYYKEFQCIADRCPDTCCAGWQIVVDERSMEKYRSICGKMMLQGVRRKEEGKDFTWKKMLGSIDWAKGTFRQDDSKRCAFLDENNLCELYKNLGQKSLCKTCKLYPRHIEEFEGLREISLSVSCPEVARILIERKTPVTFLTYEKEGEETFDDFDPFLFSILEDARTAMLQILQNREISIRERVLLILGMAHDMQVRINKQELFDCSDAIAKYQKDTALEYIRDYLKEADVDLPEKQMVLNQEMFESLYDLEVLREEWEAVLHETAESLFFGDVISYETLCREFQAWGKERDVDIHIEQLLVYFLFTYFPGAVYDGEVYAKVQMTVYCVWMIENLWMARWSRNGKNTDITEMTELVYRFSREVEHSDENLKYIEKTMEKKYFLR